jgi:hypothetical protein
VSFAAVDLLMTSAVKSTNDVGSILEFTPLPHSVA